MKKQIRKAMICTIAMMLMAVVSLTGVTYAWFTQSETAKVDSMTIGVVSKAGGVLMSGSPNTGWAYKLSVGYREDNVWPASTAPQNITAAGHLQFYDSVINEAELDLMQTRKVSLQTENTPSTGFPNGSNVTQLDSEGDYFRKDIYFNNAGDKAQNVTVYLNAVATGTTSNGAESYLRVAVVDHGAYTMNADGSVKLARTEAYSAADVKIFEVAPKSHYSNSTDPIDTFPIIAASGADFNATEESNTVSAAFNQNRTEAATTDHLTSVPNVYNSGNKLPIEVTANTYHKITVYVWLEGQDVDCINDQSGGSFGVNLDFSRVVNAAP